MLLIRELPAFPAALREGVLCIGNFDGVHLGHAQMLATGRQLAAAQGRPFIIMTFEPHPLTVLKPQSPRPPLTTLAQRLERLENFSPAAILLLTPTPAFLALTPEDFLRSIVQDRLAARTVVEGKNFTFGRAARGNVDTLRQAGLMLGWQTVQVPTVQGVLGNQSAVDISSSLIRWLVTAGRVMDAARLLGRPYALRGRVVRGAGRGRQLGFPTVNLQVEQRMPGAGVYAGRIQLGHQSFAAAVSVGANPTFGGSTVTVEAFILDYHGDLYEQTVELEVSRWLRDQRAYAHPEALRRRIAADVQMVRDYSL